MKNVFLPNQIATLFIAILLALLTTESGESKEIMTNAVIMKNAPKWLKQVRVEQVTGRIQNYLEWSTRRINVYWYTDDKKYQAAHSLGPNAMAVTKGDGKSIHLGPKITTLNFDAVFGHEMVHIIFRQKYQGSIPPWLEEGLANYLAKRGSIDYGWLAQQDLPADVKSLSHPLKQRTRKAVQLHYKTSQALVEMIAKKCDLSNLIRLSVQRKMENYIYTYCNIKDLNLAFKKWIKKMAPKQAPAKKTQQKNKSKPKDGYSI